MTVDEFERITECLNGEQVELYTDPSPTGYRSKEEFKAGEDVPLVVEGVVVGRIPVADILP